MGLQDREYYREEEQGTGWKFGSPAQSAAIQLIAAMVVGYVACVRAGQPLTRLLSLNAKSIFEPWMLWQLVSYAFVHSPESAWHIASNALGLWFFGTEVESVYGRRSFLRLFFAAVVIGAIVWLARLYFFESEDPEVLARYTLMGASGGVVAIVILFCLKFPHRTIYLMFVLPVPAWVMGLLLVLGDIMTGRGANTAGIAFDVHLTGAVLGFLFFQFGDRLGWSQTVQRHRPSGRRSSWPNPFAWLKPKPRLKIHEPSGGGKQEDGEIAYEELDERGDEVLAKWHRDGEESLSEEERKIHKAYSRRMQQKLR